MKHPQVALHQNVKQRLFQKSPWQEREGPPLGDTPADPASDEEVAFKCSSRTKVNKTTSNRVKQEQHAEQFFAEDDVRVGDEHERSRRIGRQPTRATAQRCRREDGWRFWKSDHTSGELRSLSAGGNTHDAVTRGNNLAFPRNPHTGPSPDPRTHFTLRPRPTRSEDTCPSAARHTGARGICVFVVSKNLHTTQSPSADE